MYKYAVFRNLHNGELEVKAFPSTLAGTIQRQNPDLRMEEISEDEYLKYHECLQAGEKAAEKHDD